MKQRSLVLAALLTLALLAALWGWQRQHARRVIEPGETLPFDTPAEMPFVDEETGETETWKLEKRVTRREEAIPPLIPPGAPPAPASHEPRESARTLDGIAIASWRRGELEAALAQLEQAVAADPDDPLPHSHLGRLLTTLASYEQARPHLERASQLAAQDPQVWLDLQSYYERTQRLDGALAARAHAEALAPGRAISKDELGFWTVEGAPSLP